MSGSDLSPAAAARARAECAARGLVAELAVADMRTLPWDDQSMDAAVCADNALAHLLSDEEVVAALRELYRVLRPDAPVAITTRDYDAIVQVRPTSTPPQVMDSAELGRMISFQLWTWRDGEDVYDLEHIETPDPALNPLRLSSSTTAGF